MNELPRHRRNIRINDGTYKFTTRDIAAFIRRLYPNSKDREVYGMLEASVQLLPLILAKYGYEVIFTNKGTYIVRLGGGNAQEE